MDRIQEEARETREVLDDLRNRLAELNGMVMALRDMVETNTVPSEDFVEEMFTWCDLTKE